MWWENITYQIPSHPSSRGRWTEPQVSKILQNKWWGRSSLQPKKYRKPKIFFSCDSICRIGHVTDSFFHWLIREDFKKNGKKNDIVQKGGEGLSLNHSFEFVLKEWQIWGGGGALMSCHYFITLLKCFCLLNFSDINRLNSPFRAPTSFLIY